MMTTRYCQLWEILLLSIPLLRLTNGSSYGNKCTSNCNPCQHLLNETNSHHACKMECSGSRCKEECKETVEFCEILLECSGRDCEQTCKAKQKCDMKCTGSYCKKQICDGPGEKCKMYMECNGVYCEQTCKAKTNCDMKCTGVSCKKQICEAPVEKCKMHLECNGADCEQICNAKKECYMECIGCKQTCEASKCHKNPPQHSPLSLVSPSLLLSSSLSLYTSLAEILPKETSASSPPTLASLSSSKPAAASSATTTSTAALSSTSPSQWASLSSTLGASFLPSLSSSSSYASLAAVLPAKASASSLLTSSPSSSTKPSAVSSTTTSSAAALSPTSPSPWTSPLSTLGVIEMLAHNANESIPKIGGMDMSGLSSLMEAITAFEEFIVSIQAIPKPLGKEEIEMIRKSIFNKAVALEEFALNYSKYHLIEANSSVIIDSHQLVLVIQKAYRQNASAFYLGRQELQTSMKLSPANFVNNVSVVVRIAYKDLQEVLFIDEPFTTKTGNTKYLDSGIMAVAMDQKPEELQENVILKLRNMNVHEGERKCMSWSGLNER